jgi:hypothetical protein
MWFSHFNKAIEARDADREQRPFKTRIGFLISSGRLTGRVTMPRDGSLTPRRPGW